MRKVLISALLLAMLSTPAYARGGGGGGHGFGGGGHGGGHSGRSSSGSSSRSSGSSSHRANYAPGVSRDAKGHIARSSSAKEAFMQQTGHPHGWPGHVVDHIVPLKRGGPDTPNNMQWQTTEAAKAKDKSE